MYFFIVSFAYKDTTKYKIGLIHFGTSDEHPVSFDEWTISSEQREEILYLDKTYAFTMTERLLYAFRVRICKYHLAKRFAPYDT